MRSSLTSTKLTWQRDAHNLISGAACFQSYFIFISPNPPYLPWLSFVHTKLEYCTAKDFSTWVWFPGTQTELVQLTVGGSGVHRFYILHVIEHQINQWWQWVNKSKRKSGNPMNWRLLYCQWKHIYIYTIISYWQIHREILTDIDRYNAKNTNCVDCIHVVSVVIVLNSKGK